jgi:hypothetical protein
MADKKISTLTALTAANIVAGDVLPIVDVSATETKKVSVLDVAEYVSTTTAITNLVSSKLDSTTAASTYATVANVALKADIASPTFTGTPAAPTAAASTSTTQVATTAFVINSSQDDQFVLAAAIFTS